MNLSLEKTETKPENSRKYFVVVKIEYYIAPSNPEHNIIEQAIFKLDVLPKLGAAAKVLATKLEEYAMELIKTKHL